MEVAPLQIHQAFGLARDHHQAGRAAEAEALYRQILAVHPTHAEASHWLGVIAWQTGHIDAALEWIQRAISLAPDDPGPRVNLGAALASARRHEEAIASFRLAIALRPHFPEAHCGLGVTLYEKGELRGAIEAFRQALADQPRYAEALNNLGNALRDTGELAEAIHVCRQAIAHRPDFTAAHCNLGNALKDAGRIVEAIAEFHTALRCDPRNAVSHSNLLLSLHYLADPDYDAIFAEHRRWNELHAQPPAHSFAKHTNDPAPERRLRIGYLSPDFREHAVACFFENLVECHDPVAVEVFCYHDARADDAVTARLRSHRGTWREITGLDDATVADLIRSDGIDITVDLAGHTAGNRLPVFARRTAPIQVTYLGYCDTTGLPTIDYRLTDAHADPIGATERFHSETLIRVPGCAWSYRPPVDAPTVQPSPFERTGTVTFGCFSALPKINDASLVLWSRLVLAIPGSRLLLKNRGFQEPEIRERIRAILQNAGLDPARVELRPPEPTVARHLAAYHEVDIALDTFPYHGTTTTCEALWMGVPVITRAGRTHASRVGVSLLNSVGLSEWIAAGESEFLSLATRWAADKKRLINLRSQLRTQMAQSQLTDAPSFTTGIEAAYREMWRTWCAKAHRH